MFKWTSPNKGGTLTVPSKEVKTTSNEGVKMTGSIVRLKTMQDLSLRIEFDLGELADVNVALLYTLLKKRISMTIRNEGDYES